jgi:hypothetical protein
MGWIFGSLSATYVMKDFLNEINNNKIIINKKILNKNTEQNFLKIIYINKSYFNSMVFGIIYVKISNYTMKMKKKILNLSICWY